MSKEERKGEGDHIGRKRDPPPRREPTSSAGELTLGSCGSKRAAARLLSLDGAHDDLADRSDRTERSDDRPKPAIRFAAIVMLSSPAPHTKLRRGPTRIAALLLERQLSNAAPHAAVPFTSRNRKIPRM